MCMVCGAEESRPMDLSLGSSNSRSPQGRDDLLLVIDQAISSILAKDLIKSWRWFDPMVEGPSRLVGLG